LDKISKHTLHSSVLVEHPRHVRQNGRSLIERGWSAKCNLRRCLVRTKR